MATPVTYCRRGCRTRCRAARLIGSRAPGTPCRIHRADHGRSQRYANRERSVARQSPSEALNLDPPIALSDRVWLATPRLPGLGVLKLLASLPVVFHVVLVEPVSAGWSAGHGGGWISDPVVELGPGGLPWPVLG